MKQIPTSAPMHSLTSLQAADLSVFDSIDGDVLEDYAVSLRPLKIYNKTFVKIDNLI